MRVGHIIAALIGGAWLGICGVVIADSRPQPNKAEQERRSANAAIQPAAQPSSHAQTLGTTNQTEPSANTKQTKPDKFLDKLNDPIVWLTLAIASFAFWQIQIYRQTRDHTMDIERAYIAMSHVPPGLIAKKVTDYTVVIGTQASITNHGNTPAKVHDSAVTYHVTDQPLPTAPDYGRNDQRRAGFLVRGDSMYFHGESTLTRMHWNAVTERRQVLYVIGYCEYSDAFAKRHRAGYGRFYEPDADRKENYMWRGPFGAANPPILNEEAFNRRTNLKFITQDGYNYDIEIDEQGNEKK